MITKRQDKSYLQRWKKFYGERIEGHAKEMALRLLVFASLPVICYFLFQEMKKTVAEMEQFQIYSKNIEVVKAPDWAGPSIRNSILACQLPLRFSILEDGISEKIALAFKANPWVEKVVSVEKKYPRTMRLRLKLYVPVAFISMNGSYRLLDGNGVLLPGMYEERQCRRAGLPLIATLRKSAPEVGEVWNDEGVRAGCAVAKIIKDEKDTLRTKIAVIDVMNIGGRIKKDASEIVLVTADGARILWGRSPLEWKPGELTVEQKIQNLKGIRFALALEGQPLASKEYIDIRFDPPVVKEGGIYLSRVASEN